MCSHLHFRLAQSQRSPSQSSHHKHPLCVWLRGTAHKHTHRRKKAGGKPRRPSTFHRRAAHSRQVLGKRSPPRAWLNARILTRSSTELSADPCSSTRTALRPPAVSQLLLPFPGKTRAHSRGQEPGGAAAGRLSPRASGETRTAVPAGLTYLAAAVGPAGTTGASTGRDEASGRRRQQQHRPGAGLTCWRPEEEQGRFGARSFQPPGGGEARGGRLHLRHAAGREGEREECVPGRLKASVAAG